MNESIEIVETEERGKKNTDELTKQAPYCSTLQNVINLFWLIVICLVEGREIHWDSYRIRNYEGAYFYFGLTIGGLIQMSLLLLTFRQCSKIIDWKYRSKIFPPFGTKEIIMAVLLLLTLYAYYFMSEENLIKICGWKCPLRALLSGMTSTFCIGWAFFLCCDYLQSTLEKKFPSFWKPKYYTISLPIISKRMSTARNLA